MEKQAKTSTTTMPTHHSWSDLPIEILGLFLDLLSFADHIRFSAVCTPWRSAAVTSRHHRAIHLPWLTLVPEDPSSPTLGFFSPSEGRSYHLPLDSPLCPRGRCLGSSDGWLTVSTYDPTGNNHLFNPFKNRKVSVPRTSMLPFRIYPPYIEQTVLASPPRLGPGGVWACLAVSVHSKRSGLAFCKPKYAAWIAFPEVLAEEDDYICDVMFRRGLLYCLLSTESVIVFEFGPQPTALATHLPERMPPDHPDYNRPHDRTCIYLVDSDGELLMIERYCRSLESNVGQGNHRPRCETVGFNAFKLNQDGTLWVRIESLGDRIVFLGSGCSLSLPAANAPELRQNCIYFTNDACLQDIDREYKDRVVSDLGIFCLDDGSIQPLCPDGSRPFRSPALWFKLDI